MQYFVNIRDEIERWKMWDVEHYNDKMHMRIPRKKNVQELILSAGVLSCTWIFYQLSEWVM